jgi:hypothetical protein
LGQSAGMFFSETITEHMIEYCQILSLRENRHKGFQYGYCSIY